MKAASRFLLPLEIFLGLTMFGWGFSGSRSLLGSI